MVSCMLYPLSGDPHLPGTVHVYSTDLADRLRSVNLGMKAIVEDDSDPSFNDPELVGYEGPEVELEPSGSTDRCEQEPEPEGEDGQGAAVFTHLCGRLPQESLSAVRPPPFSGPAKP